MLILAAIAVSPLTACGSGDDEPPPIKGAQYREYLEENAALLVRAIQAMRPELENGEVERAQSRYVRARVRYAQIEPIAEHFPELDAKINALPTEVPTNELAGFHRIEQPLFAAETTKGTVAPGKQMIADTKALKARLQTERFTAQQLASDSIRIIDEISTAKLGGKEEPYADADLVDVSANLEAVGAAFEALKPALSAEQRKSIEKALRKAYAVIGEYGTPARERDQPYERSPGVTFIIFSELSEEEIEALREPVDVLRDAWAELMTELD